LPAPAWVAQAQPRSGASPISRLLGKLTLADSACYAQIIEERGIAPD